MFIPKTKAAVEANRPPKGEELGDGCGCFVGGGARSLDKLGKSEEEVLRNSANQMKKKLSLASSN
jgi:hypothetical protein